MELSLLSGVSFFALTVLSLVIGACGLRNGSYLCYGHLPQASRHEMVFRKPLVLRISAAILSLAVLQFPLAAVGTSWVALIFAVLPCLAGARMFWQVSGPDELRLDLEARTFRRVGGWPFFPSASSGTWSDIRCVFVKAAGGTSTTTYFVGLRGDRLGGQMSLGRFDGLFSAELFADELASLLDLPCVTLSRPSAHSLRPARKDRSGRGTT